ncbi:hypothetical protein M0813_14200 [Anaeramoeba flamelloides]|uniref:Uncharacterized protein n=1 Tax=Anaeramoeba flamelloides TaxID=1746091 RepID=A0ABQ8Z629_9EUKA|nr:hypothetical protein M0813_14200 [Anaeramoeba flamelloides]
MEEIQKLENNRELETSLSKEIRQKQGERLEEKMELNEKRITSLLKVIGESDLDLEQSIKFHQNEIQTFSKALNNLETPLTNKKKV